MPGGLEPLDPNVYPDEDAAAVCRTADDESDLTAPDPAGPGPRPLRPATQMRGGGGPVAAAVAPVATAEPMASVASAGAVGPRAAAVRPAVPASVAAGGDEGDGDEGGGGGGEEAVEGAASAGSEGAAGGARRRLRSAAAFAPPRRPGGGGGGWWGIWPPWPVCPAQQTMPAVVTLRYDFLSAGAHTVRFKAVAATPGDFLLPPVKAYAAKQPEVMGLSAGARFTVCGARGAVCAPAGAAAAAPAPAPRRCPADCSGNGACNLVSGACICDRGFAGPACETRAVVRR
jgi:hypothetical protein